MKRKVTLYLPAEAFDELKRAAEVAGQTMSMFVQRALESKKAARKAGSK